MPRRRNRAFFLAFGLLWLLGLIATCGCVRSSSGMLIVRNPRSFFDEQRRADWWRWRAEQARNIGDFERAERLFRRVRRIDPERAEAALQHAWVLARLGRHNESLSAVERAALLGQRRADALEWDDVFAPLRERDRFEAAVARMHQNESDFSDALTDVRRPLAPDRAAAFATYSTLAAHFDARADRIERGRPRHVLARDVQQLALISHERTRLAALERYAAEHPEADDLELAALDGVRTLGRLIEPWAARWDRQLSAELRAAAKSFGERFPDSVHTTEAAYHAAAAAIRGTRERGSTSQDDVSTPLACEGMLAALEPIASDASPNNPWSTAASGLRALCLGELRPDPPEPVIEAIDRYIELSESDESSLTEFDGRLRLELSITRLAASDLPDFALTDLDGVEASLARYRGKLLLLDFWAPG